MLITGKRLDAKLTSDERQLSINTSGGEVIEQVDSAKLLGLVIDKQMSFTNHIDTLCKKLSQRIGVLVYWSVPRFCLNIEKKDVAAG